MPSHQPAETLHTVPSSKSKHISHSYTPQLSKKSGTKSDRSSATNLILAHMAEQNSNLYGSGSAYGTKTEKYEKKGTLLEKQASNNNHYNQSITFKNNQ